VLTRGSRRVVVTDHSKFGKQGLVQVCGFGGVDELVTDHAPPVEIAAKLHEAGARLTIAAHQGREGGSDD
jgi:DeoR family glycerol-3-phosphate regulon repressor